MEAEGLNQNLEQLNLLGDDISPAAYYGFILGKGDDIVVFADLRRDSLAELKQEEAFLRLRGIALIIRIYLDLEDVESAQKSLQTLSRHLEEVDSQYFAVLRDIYENEIKIKTGKKDEAILSLENILSSLEDSKNIAEKNALIFHAAILLAQVYWNAEAEIPLKETLDEWAKLGARFQPPAYYFYRGELESLSGLKPQALASYERCVKDSATPLWKEWLVRASTRLAILDDGHSVDHIERLKNQRRVNSKEIKLVEAIVKMSLALNNFKTKDEVSNAVELMSDEPSLEIAILCARVFIRENQKDWGRKSAEFILERATEGDLPGKKGLALLFLATLSQNNEEKLALLSLSLILLKDFGQRPDYAQALFENQYLKRDLGMDTDLESTSLEMALIGGNMKKTTLSPTP